MPISRGKSAEEGPDFERLFEPHRLSLMRQARNAFHLCVDNAEDLVQDTFFRAYAKKDQFDLMRAEWAKAWLHRIMLRLFLKMLSAQKSSHEVSLDEGVCDASIMAGRAQLLYGQCGYSGDDFLSEYVSPQIQSAIAALSEQHRTVLLLYVIEELDYREIANILDVPVGTVRSRLFWARKYLKAALPDWPNSISE